jgi:hypothetical protein
MVLVRDFPVRVARLATKATAPRLPRLPPHQSYRPRAKHDPNSARFSPYAMVVNSSPLSSVMEAQDSRPAEHELSRHRLDLSLSPCPLTSLPCLPWRWKHTSWRRRRRTAGYPRPRWPRASWCEPCPRLAIRPNSLATTACPWPAHCLGVWRCSRIAVHAAVLWSCCCSHSCCCCAAPDERIRPVVSRPVSVCS